MNTFEQLPTMVFHLSQKVDELSEAIILLTQKSSDPQHLAPDELLTVQQAAQFLSLSVPTIYGLIHRKAIPCMKRSKRVYFSKDELIKYLKEGAVIAPDYVAATDKFLSTCKAKGGVNYHG